MSVVHERHHSKGSYSSNYLSFPTRCLFLEREKKVSNQVSWLKTKKKKNIEKKEDPSFVIMHLCGEVYVSIGVVNMASKRVTSGNNFLVESCGLLHSPSLDLVECM